MSSYFRNQQSKHVDCNKGYTRLEKRARVERNKGVAVLDERRVLRTKKLFLNCCTDVFMLGLFMTLAEKASFLVPTMFPLRRPTTMTALLNLSFLLLISNTVADTPSSQYSTGSDAYQSANLDITSWTGANCAGTAIRNTGIQYDYNMKAQTLSYSLSRPLGSAEQLDWSGPPNGFVARGVDQYCGMYDHTASAGQGTGCVTFQKTFTCFRLWHY